MYLGIDLAAVETRPTEICLMDDEVRTWTVQKDDKILQKVDTAEVVAVDAPLTETDKAFREAERELMKEHGPILPLNTPGMVELSERALRLFGDRSNVIETYPRAVESSLGMSREGVRYDFEEEHQYDAFLCSFTAGAYAEDEYICYGEGDETIIIPHPDYMGRSG